MTWPLSHPSTPTSDCDQAQPGSGTGEAALGPPAIPAGDTVGSTDEPVYDSCLDDLNAILAATPEPDPFLGDREPASPSNQDGRLMVESDPDAERKRTSEVFRAVLGQPATAYVDSWVATGGISVNTGGEPGTTALPPDAGDSSSPTTAERDSVAEAGSGESGSMRSAWVQLVLASYASALTLALVWVLWSGRSIQRPEVGAAEESSKAAVEVADARPVRKVADPPLPARNVTSIGKVIRLGDLEVTAVDIHSAPVRLIRTIDPEQVREGKDRSLILRLEFKNVDNNHTLAPLDREFVREPWAGSDDSYIESSDGTRIPLFPLATDSEWSIAGQDFSPISPGGSLMTLLVSAAIDPSALADPLTWRIRVRTGLYDTTVLGVSFAKKEIKKERSSIR